MNNYIEVKFSLIPFNSNEGDVLCALLADKGYDSFENNNDTIKAYIVEKDYSESNISETLSEFGFSSKITWSKKLIIGQDWNEKWEKDSFKPIIIGEQCVIHSTMYNDYPQLKYDIVINPKMSFGTGHHETTIMMVEEIIKQNLDGKAVMDMGTGTGILAILCEKKGAKLIEGVEIDSTAYENAICNAELNNCKNVNIYNGDAAYLQNNKLKYDLFLANINRNIILNDIELYSESIKPKGYLQLSGFYTEDVPMICNKALEYNLRLIEQNAINNWTMLLLQKQ